MCNSFKKMPGIAAFMAVFALFTFLSTEASAQLWFGGGLVFGSEVENLGLQANGHLVVNEENKIRVGADITYFFSDKASSGDLEVKTNIFAINVNGHYMLVDSDLLILYALAGLNFGFVNVEVSGPGSQFAELFDTNDTEIGLNAGGGVEYTVPFGRIYGEVKYVLGGFDQLVIGGGVRIPISGGN